MIRGQVTMPQNHRPEGGGQSRFDNVIYTPVFILFYFYSTPGCCFYFFPSYNNFYMSYYICKQKYLKKVKGYKTMREKFIKLLEIAEKFKNKDGIEEMKLTDGAIMFKIDGVWYIAQDRKTNDNTHMTLILDVDQDWQKKVSYIGSVDDSVYNDFAADVDKYIDLVNKKLGGI